MHMSRTLFFEERSPDLYIQSLGVQRCRDVRNMIGEDCGMGKKTRKKFEKKKLDDQLRIFFSVMIAGLMGIMLAISTVSAISSSYQKSAEQAASQLDFMASSYHTWLTTANDLIISLESDEAVQEFCGCQENSGTSYQQKYTDLSNFLQNYLYVNSDVNFISVINDKNGEYVIRGKNSITRSKFDMVYAKNYEKSQYAKRKGVLRMDYGNEYYGGEKYTVTFYLPVYSVTTVGKQIGVACINMNDSMLQSTHGSDNYELCMTDEEGNLIYSTNEQLMGTHEKVLDFGENTEGSIRKDGKCYFFKKIPNWNYYVVSSIPFKALYQSSIRIAVLMAVLTVIIMAASLIMMRRMITKTYAPLQRVVDAMDQVSEKQLDFRIQTSDMGEDFEKLGVGYNEMMDDIQKLMKDVLTEQHQADQIRLNALQSQIQPHFLYNTLDCIHWQALADGNKETSELVMALSRYYRLCLSKGKDIIPLRQELEHVKCYLLIQNKRYGDIIHYKMTVEEKFMDVKIPKLTLQPLIENSIYHGIRIKENISGTVCICAEKKDGDILLKVIDSGRGMAEEAIEEMNNSISNYDEEFGYGVRNVNRRIELTFGNKYGLHYLINENGGVTVEILLPEEYDEEADSIFGGRGYV